MQDATLKNLRPRIQLKKAILFILAAAFFNTVMIVFVKVAAKTLPTQVIVFARCFITLLITLPFIYYNPEQKSMLSYLKTNRILLHVFRDSMGLISILCYFYAAKKITLADATVLFNTAPLFVPIIFFFWGRFKIFPKLWLGMTLGFLGIIFILHPGRELFHLPAIIGLASGVTGGIAFVGSRYLLYTETPLRNMFYYFLTGTLIALFLLFTIRGWAWDLLDVKSMLLLLGVGIFGYLYQLCFTYGAKHAPIRLTSSFMYSAVIFSLILDWLLWKIVPTFQSCIGIILIILGAFLLLFMYPKDDYQVRN